MKNDISPQNGDHIVVWVSYGAASAVAASETLRKYGDRCRISLINNPRPEVFQQRAVQSRALGVRLVRHKGERIFLDELPEDIQGRPLKQLDFECGVFCEERIQEDVEKT